MGGDFAEGKAETSAVAATNKEQVRNPVAVEVTDNYLVIISRPEEVTGSQYGVVIRELEEIGANDLVATVEGERIEKNMVRKEKNVLRIEKREAPGKEVVVALGKTMTTALGRRQRWCWRRHDSNID